MNMIPSRKYMLDINKYIIAIYLSFFFLYSCEKEVSTSPPMDPVPIGFIKISSKSYKVSLLDISDRENLS